MKNYTSATIKRMKEVYRMWRMMRLLAKNRFVWGSALIRIGATNKDYEVNGEMVPGRSLDSVILQSEVSTATTSYNQEVRVKKVAICNAYILKYHPELNTMKESGGVGFDTLDKKFQTTHLEAQSILDSCIQHDLINEDQSSKELVYLTGEGKKFPGIDGLIKAEIKEAGVLRTALSAVLLTSGAWKWSVIYSWVIKFIHLFK